MIEIPCTLDIRLTSQGRHRKDLTYKWRRTLYFKIPFKNYKDHHPLPQPGTLLDHATEKGHFRVRPWDDPVKGVSGLFSTPHLGGRNYWIVGSFTHGSLGPLLMPHHTEITLRGEPEEAQVHWFHTPIFGYQWRRAPSKKSKEHGPWYIPYVNMPISRSYLVQAEELVGDFKTDGLWFVSRLAPRTAAGAIRIITDPQWVLQVWYPL